MSLCVPSLSRIKWAFFLSTSDKCVTNTEEGSTTVQPSTSAFLFLSSGTQEAWIPNTGSTHGIPPNLVTSLSPMFIAINRSGITDDRSISFPLSRNLYSLGSSSILSRTPIVGSNIPISFAKFVLAPVIRSRRSPPFFLSAKTSNP